LKIGGEADGSSAAVRAVPARYVVRWVAGIGRRCLWDARRPGGKAGRIAGLAKVAAGGDGMQVESYAESAVPRELGEQVVALQEQAWPSDGSSPPRASQAGHDPALSPVSMLLVQDGTVLAALSILTKDITHDAESYTASGLSTVVTDQAERGRGYGRQLVLAAHSAIQASGVDLGIFTCDRPLQRFYESAGWHTVAGAVLIGGTPQAPFPSDQFDKVTLAEFFSTKAQRNADSFTNSRIQLYPGEIDKLW
jgi:aminoglycoside 2'-N-acetyltransferase I